MKCVAVAKCYQDNQIVSVWVEAVDAQDETEMNSMESVMANDLLSEDYDNAEVVIYPLEGIDYEWAEC